MVVGMNQMRRKNVVVRDLSALEALGGVTNICSDKTGTLTQGAMIVKKVWLPKVGIFTVNNSIDPNNPTEGSVTKKSETINVSREENKMDYDLARSTVGLQFDVPAEKLAKDEQNTASGKSEVEEEASASELEDILHPISLCNLATVRKESSQWQTTGEPTEIALQVFAHRFDGFGKPSLVSSETGGWKQVEGAEFPFNSSIKRMTVVYNHRDHANSIIFTKGAVERVVDLCTSVGTGPHCEKLTNHHKEHINYMMEHLASQGFRVLAIASREWNGKFSIAKLQSNDENDRARADVEQDLTLVGLVGIYDPPRVETKGAIEECFRARIVVHMLTVSHLTSINFR
jgi:Na+-exporting ATPase